MVQTLITLNFILSWTAEAKKKYDKLNVQNKSVLYAAEFNDDDVSTSTIGCLWTQYLTYSRRNGPKG